MELKEYLKFLIILGSSLILGKIFHYFLKFQLKKLAQKTKTDIDDVILNLASTPLFILIILSGVYLAIKTLIYQKWVEKIFFTVFILIFAFLLSRVLSFLVSHWLKIKKQFKKTPKLIPKIIALVIYLLGVLIILDYFGIAISPFVASLGIGGVAIALALQTTLSDVFAGFHILSDRPIKVGDFVEIEGGISGWVEDIGWRSTRIRTRINNFVIIPNTKLAQSLITNLSAPQKETKLIVNCGVSYDSDLEKVEKITLKVAQEIQKEIKGAVKNFQPKMGYSEFGDSNINFWVILMAETPIDKYTLKHEFIKRLKKIYDKEKIEISWPVRKIYSVK